MYMYIYIYVICVFICISWLWGPKSLAMPYLDPLGSIWDLLRVPEFLKLPHHYIAASKVPEQPPKNTAISKVSEFWS